MHQFCLIFREVLAKFILDNPLSFKHHCVKIVEIQSFSGPYFPVFGLEKTPYLDTFHAASAFNSQLFLAKRSIWDVWQGSEYTSGICLSESWKVIGYYQKILTTSPGKYPAEGNLLVPWVHMLRSFEVVLSLAYLFVFFNTATSFCYEISIW